MFYRAIAFAAAFTAAEAAHAATLGRFMIDQAQSVQIDGVETFFSDAAGLLSGEDAGGLASISVEFDASGFVPAGAEVALFDAPLFVGDAVDVAFGDDVIRFLLAVAPGSDASWGAFAIATLSFDAGSFGPDDALTTSALALASLTGSLSVQSATPIPLPAALPMIAVALGALAVAGRRRR